MGSHVPPARIEIIDATQGSPLTEVVPVSVELEVSKPQIWAIGVAVVLVALLLAGVDRAPDDSDRALPTPVTIRTQTSATTFDGNPEWPAPTEKLDPSYVGRPGTQEPVRSYLVDKTLLYVNEFGRPTIVDLSTGDQREVLISDGREQDRFELEFGQIVTSDSELSDLPPSIGRSIVVTGIRAASEVEPEDRASLVLCLDGAECPGQTTALELQRSVGGSAVRLDTDLGAESSIAQLLRVSEWTTEQRWTLFGSDPNASVAPVRIPTPHPEAVVWLIEQAR